MSYKLLFNKSKKILRKELKPAVVGKDQYEDIARLKDELATQAEDEVLRIRFIRDEPVPAYRATVLKWYKKIHKVKCKDGRDANLSPGWYVERQFWIERVADGFIYTPPLKDTESA